MHSPDDLMISSLYFNQFIRKKNSDQDFSDFGFDLIVYRRKPTLNCALMLPGLIFSKYLLQCCDRYSS